MKFLKIKNNSNFDLDGSEELFHSLGQFAQERFGFKKPPVLNLVSDDKNAGKPLGKTAYYDPQSLAVTIYTDGRHTKDVLRSLAHELVHHTQNENGMLNDSGYHGEGYAQKNKDLRQSEKEAYLKGNMCFRDWEDQLKQDKPTIYNERRINNMSTKEWKRKELMENLSEKFGFKMNLQKLNEGEIPAGLKKYQDEQKAKKGEDSEEPEEKPEDDEGKDEKSDDEKVSSDGKMPMKDEPAGKDLNKDGKKGHGKVPAFLKEKEDKKEMKESRIMKIIKQEIRKQLEEVKKKGPDTEGLEIVQKAADYVARYSKDKLTKAELQKEKAKATKNLEREEKILKKLKAREKELASKKSTPENKDLLKVQKGNNKTSIKEKEKIIRHHKNAIKKFDQALKKGK
jgi:hypothetical protein